MTDILYHTCPSIHFQIKLNTLIYIVNLHSNSLICLENLWNKTVNFYTIKCTYFAYAFSSKAGQNSVEILELTKMSLLLIVGSWSSMTTSIHFPNRQNCSTHRNSKCMLSNKDMMKENKENHERGIHPKMKYSGIILAEWLFRWNDLVHNILLRTNSPDWGQKPAVSLIHKRTWLCF